MQTGKDRRAEARNTGNDGIPRPGNRARDGVPFFTRPGRYAAPQVMPPRGDLIPVLDKPCPGGNQTRDSDDDQTYGVCAHGRIEYPLHGGPRLRRGRHRHHDAAHGQKRGLPGHEKPQHIAEYLAEIRPGEGVRRRVGLIRGPAKVQQPAAQRRNAVYQVPDDGNKQPHSVH